MGTIYEIICWTTGLRYVGRTTKKKFNKRLTEHKSLFKTKPEKYCTSFLVLEHNNYEIYELERVEDESMLNEREQYYIRHTDCVNVNIGDFDRKEYNKKYHEINRDIILERLREYDRNRRPNKIERYEKKKEKYTCKCGSTLTIGKKSRHEKSKKHLNFLKNNSTNKDETKINISNDC